MQAYNDDIRIQAKRDAGMTEDEAVTDLKRDKLKTALRASFLEQHSDEIDRIPPSVIDRIPMDRLPRFELAKKGDLGDGETASNRKTSLGGVIKIDRSADTSEASTEVGRHIRLAFAKTAFDEIGTVQDLAGRDTRFSYKVVYHWERKQKTIDDLDGRLAHLPQIVNGVSKPDHVRQVDRKLHYLRSWTDGAKTKYGCVIVKLDGEVENCSVLVEEAGVEEMDRKG